MTLENELFEATETGDANRVIAIIREGGDVNARDEHQATPLIRAASQDRTDIVKLLLGQGANAALQDDEQYTALDRAALDLKSGNETEKVLLEHWRERYHKEQPIPPERVREFLDAHSYCYHAAFRLRNGSTREGSMGVEEDRDVVLFKEAPGIFSDTEWDENWFKN